MEVYLYIAHSGTPCRDIGYIHKVWDLTDNVRYLHQDFGWWAQSTEDPWQCLATCLEIAAAIRSGDPESYVCR